MLANPPSTLIFDRRERNEVSVIGAYPKATSESWRDSIFTHPGPEHCPLERFPDSTNFSSAPLRDVTSARLYYRKGHPRCRGILFAYRNGAQRALGDCRLGVDPYRAQESPRFMCTLATTDQQPFELRALQTVQVEFAERCTHGGEEAEVWNCYEMKGTLRFWFNDEECQLEVLEN